MLYALKRLTLGVCLIIPARRTFCARHTYNVANGGTLHV